MLYPVHNNFTAGEISPLLNGRVDFEKRNQGVASLENMLVLPHGGVTRRYGSQFVAKVKDSTRATRLIPFEYSTTQAYIIEVGDLYMRFYRDGGIVTQTAQNITGITKANPAVVTYDGADTYANGDRVIITGVVGMTQVNNREFTVANVNAGANTFELSGVNSSSYDTYSSGGTVAEIVELTTTYAEADLFNLKFCQNADNLYIFHTSYRPRKLTRSSHTAWTLTEVAWEDGPYLDENTTATTITPSAATGNITLTASASLFAAGHVGSVWRIKVGVNPYGYVRITNFTSDTLVDATVLSTLTAAAATAVWREGAWSGVRGWPECGTFHDQRLIVAATSNEPANVWGSEVSDFENFTPGTSASNPFTYKLGTNKVNRTKWLSSGQNLILGTTGGEAKMNGGSTDTAITPSNVAVRFQTRRGSGNVAPIQLDEETLFIQKAGRKLRRLAFDLNADSYKAQDLTLLSEHITLGGIVDMAYEQEPYGLVWAVRDDGVGVTLTYLPEHNVIGWARQITDGEYESFATIPHWDGDKDVTFAVVKRTINSATVRYVEFFDPDLYTDAGLSYSGSAVQSLGGLFHLEGETVHVRGDGAAYPNATVTNGKVTLDGNTAEAIEIGLPYTPEIETLEPEVKLPGGSSIGKRKKWAIVKVRLFETIGITVEGDDVSFRSSDDEMDEALPEFTGDVKVSNTGWGTGVITISQPQPLPFTVLAIFGDLEVEGSGGEVE